MTETTQSVSAALGNVNGKPNFNPRTSTTSDIESNGATFASLLKTGATEASFIDDELQIMMEEAFPPPPTIEEPINTETADEEIPPDPEEHVIVLNEDLLKGRLRINFTAESNLQIQQSVRATDSKTLAPSTNTLLDQNISQVDKGTAKLKKTDSPTLTATRPQVSVNEQTAHHEMQVIGQTREFTTSTTIIEDTTVVTTPPKVTPEAFRNVETSKQAKLTQTVATKHTRLNDENVESPLIQGVTEESKNVPIARISASQHHNRTPTSNKSDTPVSPQEHPRLNRDLNYRSQRNHPDVLPNLTVHSKTEPVEKTLDGQSVPLQKLFDTITDVDQKIHPDRLLQIEPTSRSNSPSSVIQTQAPSGPSQAEARFIANQLGTQLSNQKERTTTIRLNPEELGQVRMTLRTGEAGLALIIAAERPETSEIMRRNIDVLAQEFESLGFDNLNFQFDGDASDSNSGHPIDQTLTDEGDTPQTLNSPPQHKIDLDGRLDLRI